MGSGTHVIIKTEVFQGTDGMLGMSSLFNLLHDIYI